MPQSGDLPPIVVPLSKLVHTLLLSTHENLHHPLRALEALKEPLLLRNRAVASCDASLPSRAIGQAALGDFQAHRTGDYWAPNSSYTGGFGAQRTKASAYCRPHSMPRHRLQTV